MARRFGSLSSSVRMHGIVRSYCIRRIYSQDLY